MAGCKVIALYGGVGSGKSQATEYLKNKYKAYIIQADKVAHNLYRKSQPGYNAVKRIAGKNAIGDTGIIDRKILGEYLIKNPDKIKLINQAIHPMVYKKTAELIDNYMHNHKHGIIIYEAALLPDKDLKFIDEIWFIKSDEKIRRDRLKSIRHYDDAKIDSILANQPDEKIYESIADKVILNNGTIKELEEKIDAAL